MNAEREEERAICCRCGATASVWEPRSMSCFCRECAVALADALLLDMTPDEKLDCARFEEL